MAVAVVAGVIHRGHHLPVIFPPRPLTAVIYHGEHSDPKSSDHIAFKCSKRHPKNASQAHSSPSLRPPSRIRQDSTTRKRVSGIRSRQVADLGHRPSSLPICSPQSTKKVVWPDAWFHRSVAKHCQTEPSINWDHSTNYPSLVRYSDVASRQALSPSRNWPRSLNGFMRLGRLFTSTPATSRPVRPCTAHSSPSNEPLAIGNIASNRPTINARSGELTRPERYRCCTSRPGKVK